MLDLTSNPLFGVLALSESVNNAPHVPGRLSALIPWNERGITTTSLLLEEKNGVLAIVNPSPRGGVGDAVPKGRRTGRTLTIPHYQINDGVNADEVQGIREFGTEASLMTVRGYVDSRMEELAADFDITLEYQRLGAVKGIILNGDGTVLYNLFTEFGVTQEAEIDFDLDDATPEDGELRERVQQTRRTISRNLLGAPISRVHAICGDDFFDALLKHKEVRDSYKNTSMATVLRESYVNMDDRDTFGTFEFGGIVWENTQGEYDGTPFVETDKCYIFPIGPNLWKTRFAPADYNETVNTVGAPRYSKMYQWPNDKGYALEMQSNALSYMTRPKALMKGTI